MEGVDRRVGLAVGHEHVDASLHLLRRVVGEGQRQDLARHGTLGRDQPGGASSHDLRLARAGSGEHERRSRPVSHGTPLFAIQAAQ